MKRCYKSHQQFHPGDGVCLGFNCPGFHGEKHDRRGPSAQIDETVGRFHDVKEKQDVIVRELKDVIGSWRHASGDGWESRRIVLADDRMGCSLHDTLVREGAELHLEYKNHLEVNYCIEGEGEVVDVATGTIWPIRPGTMYALDKHDRHILRATKGDLRLVCTFSPALSGCETHDADGSYRLAD